MPNEPQKPESLNPQVPVPSVVNIGEKHVGVNRPELPPKPFEPVAAVAPETIGNSPPLVGQTVVVKVDDPPKPVQEVTVGGDFSHLPPESRLFGVAQMASNWIRRILGREGEKGKARLKAKTV